ncbi:SET domain-containing protein [Rhizobium sp. BK650]|uniref:SET domain-containing protein-lysine N-methyltransferase n=1 Tax=Rhizobium sp. BK650 TaxID=2586990 RepID=UPI0016174E55|nr:SET domain-containing protein [Rhizobium sp. BK650]MBB3656486.1 SET domain-containing protein [Rhizobium sp. BK650]
MTYTNWNLVEEIDLSAGEKGIVAKSIIAEGTLLGVYDGEIQVFDVENNQLINNREHKYIVQVALIESKLLGLVTETRSGVDYIIHSCTPNVVPVDRIVLKAARRIEKGETLTMDYTKWDFIPEGIRCWCADAKCVL